MNIVFMGTIDFSVKSLVKVHEKYGVKLVVTQPDKYVGRKKVLTINKVKEKALELGIEVFQPISIKNDYQRILDVKPDLVITAAYGQFIPSIILDTPRLGAINVHGSLLPKYRGGAPIQRAILNGDKETGVTIMYMASKMDAGDMISSKKTDILKTDTSDSLFERLGEIGSDLLIDTLPSIINGTNEKVVQDESLVTYAYNLKREEEKIDWNKTTSLIDCHIRAFTSFAYVYTVIGNLNVKIYDLEVFYNDELNSKLDQFTNGEIALITKKFFVVKCSDGFIKVNELQLPGKKRMNASSFLNGVGRKLISYKLVLH